MKTFEYTRPTSLEEVFHLIGQDGDGSVRPLAGGTDLLTLMKADLAAPAQLVDLKRAYGLAGGLEEVDGGLTMGALMTLTEIERHPLIRRRYAALSEAAEVAATPQLRNMATLGGNLLQRPRCWYFRNPRVHCWLKGGDECQAKDGENQLHALFGGGPCYAVHPSDIAPALLALDAQVLLQSPRGERALPIGDFFGLPEEGRRTETVISHDELVVSVQLPAPAEGTRSTYLKAMDRKIWAFALVGVAARLRLNGDRIEDARLILSGVAPVPWRAEAAERELIGAEAGEATFQRAAETALAGAQPLEKNGYKAPLAKTLVRRALAALTAG